MKGIGIRIDHFPELQNPILVAGFGGWGNALNVSKAMVEYLIDKTKTKQVAEIETDMFYRMDESRPDVVIEEGNMKKLSFPGGGIFAGKTGPLENDFLALIAQEPSLAWHSFVDQVLDFSIKSGVHTVLTLGSMYDNVLHTDRVVSGFFSSNDLLNHIKTRRVIPISYKGPSAIHSLFMNECRSRGLDCISLWCHCPYYMQGTKHFGLMAHLADLISFIGEFHLDSSDLITKWEALSRQIRILIDGNEQLKKLIEDLKKEKRRGHRAVIKKGVGKSEKIIDLQDFLT